MEDYDIVERVEKEWERLTKNLVEERTRKGKKYLNLALGVGQFKMLVIGSIGPNGYSSIKTYVLDEQKKFVCDRLVAARNFIVFQHKRQNLIDLRACSQSF